MKITLLSPKKSTSKIPSEIQCESAGYKQSYRDCRKLSGRNTPKTNSKIPLKIRNKNSINNQKLSDICYNNSLLRQNTTESRNKQMFVNSSKIKLSRIIDEEISPNNKSSKNRIINHFNVNYNTPQNNNIKLELKIDSNKSNNLKLFSPKDKLMLRGTFRNLNINKNINHIENEINTNNQTSNNSYNIFNINKTQNRNENKVKINQAAIYLKTDISDNQKSNKKDDNAKILLGNQSLLKKNLLTNQSSDFGSTNSNNIKINEPKKIFAMKGSKVNLHKTKDVENILIMKGIKDDLIKETVTNVSTNNESKFKKRKTTIDSKSSRIQTINYNGFQGGKTYCPEEIHFYYVNMVQGGKMFEGLIDGEYN